MVNPPYVFNNPGQITPIPGGQLDKTNDEIDRLQFDVDAKSASNLRYKTKRPKRNESKNFTKLNASCNL